jgi:hypothetical protein
VVSESSGNADYYVPQVVIQGQTDKVVASSKTPEEGVDVPKTEHSQWQLTEALLGNTDKKLTGTDVDDEHTCPDFVRSIAKEEAVYLRYNLTGAPAAELAALKIVGTIHVQG